MKTPHIHLVPKGFDENLRFRKLILTEAEESRDMQIQLEQMCREDILFWINSFVFTYDPRKDPSAIPFITWEFQDEALADLHASIIEGHDIAIAKSRDMGASWLMVLVCAWFYLFHPLKSFLMLSRKQEYVDKSGDPKTLFWKIDFVIDNLPRWMQPNQTRNRLHFHNEDNGSTIDGESTNGDAGRGDRRSAIILDEFAAVENGRAILTATGDTTNCRIFNSTPMGTANAFYDVVHSGSCKVLRLHWTRHPEKAAGLYYDDRGRPRSPWYDAECERRFHPVEIAQELDIDFAGSAYTFFDENLITQCMAHTRQPDFVGEVVYEPHTCEFIGFSPSLKGRLKLWCPLDEYWNPPQDRLYSIGVDVATGTGSSNSCMTIFDTKEGRKVAEFSHPMTRPEELAEIAFALGRMFRGEYDREAFLVWESNGPGRNFGARLVELGYRNLYYREVENRVVKDRTQQLGWASTRDTKNTLLGGYRLALQNGQYTNPSREAVEELRQYVFAANGAISHARAENKSDPSGARDNHGDRVIADALAFKGMGQQNLRKIDFDKIVKGDSIYSRRIEADRSRRLEASSGWGVG